MVVMGRERINRNSSDETKETEIAMHELWAQMEPQEQENAIELDE